MYSKSDFWVEGIIERAPHVNSLIKITRTLAAACARNGLRKSDGVRKSVMGSGSQNGVRKSVMGSESQNRVRNS